MEEVDGRCELDGHAAFFFSRKGEEREEEKRGGVLNISVGDEEMMFMNYDSLASMRN